MKNKAVKIFLAVIAVCVIAGAATVFTEKHVSEKNALATQPLSQEVGATESDVEVETTTEKQPVTVSFVSAGDNLIHHGIYEQAQKRAGGTGYDFSYCYKYVAPIISKADVATVNQETIISQSNAPSGYPLFNSPKEVGTEIAKTGFDVVNLANNHMLDKGATGLSQAIDFWNGVDGVVKTGAYKNEADLNKVEYIEKNGLKIGLVGVTQYTNGLSLPSGSELEIIYSSDEQTIERKIKAAKESCDMVLVNIHWGNEYSTVPTAAQRELAKKMSDWGADVIIGHHPHVIEPVEFIDRADGSKTLVAYSLGNFISQQNTPARVIGGLLHYNVTKDCKTNKLTIDNVSFEPIITQYVRGSQDVTIYPLSQYTDKLASSQSARLGEKNFNVSYINDFVSKIIDAQFLK